MALLLAPPRHGRRDWAEAAAMLAVLGALCWTCGRASGLLPPAEPHLDPGTLGRAAASLVAPAMVEEAIFRGPLLRPDLHRPVVAVALLAAYVSWHPLGALLRPDLARVLADPVFLGLVACVGLACTVSAWRSRSIRPAVAMHFGIVAGWILLFGGLTPAQA